MTTDQLEWLLLTRYDDLDYDQLLAADYALDLIYDCEDAVGRLGGHNKFAERMLCVKIDEYKANIVEMLRWPKK